ncbi:hypothetical protein [Dethiobacter alkaliphilus]|uniref:Uncharacterized protein n=1 Tax=Dethiobacter alkaliphilus AHT 1 TaxID=555088 RepID=C0GDC8_DETAL|nr:hypothetical protein [Dethiobacter alkaliphilus]EEG78649.1 hypothetical protein DealDRAFT_0579 [Dethiobacter alkaliphilus AHT 1]
MTFWGRVLALIIFISFSWGMRTLVSKKFTDSALDREEKKND